MARQSCPCSCPPLIVAVIAQLPPGTILLPVTVTPVWLKLACSLVITGGDTVRLFSAQNQLPATLAVLGLLPQADDSRRTPTEKPSARTLLEQLIFICVSSKERTNESAMRNARRWLCDDVACLPGKFPARVTVASP